ncbi:MAG: secretin N-terminal domain-containing protein, partial [Planctomycetota bacterium]
KGKTTENGLKLDLNINYRQLRPGFGTHKDDEGREIQVPIIESRECATSISLRSDETIVIGGLRSNEKPLRNLILMITPSIVLPEKGPEQTKIEIEGGAVYGDPGLGVEFSDAEKEKIKTYERLAELQSPLMVNLYPLQEEDLKIALEDQALELQQQLHEIQTKLAELETRKAELSELNRLSSALALAKEPKSEHERLAVMAAKFAERGDFNKAIELIEKAIELVRAQKYYGIGIAIGKTDGLIRISEVLPNTPASGSSFQQGDIIEAIDGVSTEGMSLDEVVAKIVGPKDTKVTLTVKSHSQDITMKETFTRQLPLGDSSALEMVYQQDLDTYKAGMTLPQYFGVYQPHSNLPQYQPHFNLPQYLLENFDDQLKNPYASTVGATRIFELKYANAEELAGVLSRILERRWKGIKDKPAQAVRIIPEPNRNRLIVIASPDDIQLIEALIVELDVIAKRNTVILKAIPSTEAKQGAPVESNITQIINLKYADCESVAQILQQLISDKQLKIVPDKRTNMLLVAGTETAIKKVTDLVAAIDIPGSDTDREVMETNKY